MITNGNKTIKEKKSPLLASCKTGQRQEFNFATEIGWQALADGEHLLLI
jgi:protein tyrosine phosphatase (PTP) superfamily phosphohydrolase (DUF442 family)